MRRASVLHLMLHQSSLAGIKKPANDCSLAGSLEFGSYGQT